MPATHYINTNVKLMIVTHLSFTERIAIASDSYTIFLFYLFSPNEQCGGWGGGYAARLFLLFSFPCSADHERDWPPCKVVFLGLATNTLNVR